MFGLQHAFPYMLTNFTDCQLQRNKILSFKLLLRYFHRFFFSSSYYNFFLFRFSILCTNTCDVLTQVFVLCIDFLVENSIIEMSVAVALWLNAFQILFVSFFFFLLKSENIVLNKINLNGLRSLKITVIIECHYRIESLMLSITLQISYLVFTTFFQFFFFFYFRPIQVIKCNHYS